MSASTPALASRHLARGYTLIEMMIAGTLLGLTVMGVVSLLRNGRDLEKSVDLKRQANGLLVAALEDTAFTIRKYPVAVGVQTTAVTLDQSSDRPIPGTLTVKVNAVDFITWDKDVVFQKIQGKLSWTVDGMTDSVNFTRRLSRVWWK